VQIALRSHGHAFTAPERRRDPASRCSSSRRWTEVAAEIARTCETSERVTLRCAQSPGPSRRASTAGEDGGDDVGGVAIPRDAGSVDQGLYGTVRAQDRASQRFGFNYCPGP
jgi:hypothetical protein